MREHITFKGRAYAYEELSDLISDLLQDGCHIDCYDRYQGKRVIFVRLTFGVVGNRKFVEGVGSGFWWALQQAMLSSVYFKEQSNG